MGGRPPASRRRSVAVTGSSPVTRAWITLAAAGVLAARGGAGSSLARAPSGEQHQQVVESHFLVPVDVAQADFTARPPEAEENQEVVEVNQTVLVEIGGVARRNTEYVRGTRAVAGAPVPYRADQHLTVGQRAVVAEAVVGSAIGRKELVLLRPRCAIEAEIATARENLKQSIDKEIFGDKHREFVHTTLFSHDTNTKTSHLLGDVTLD